MTKFSRVRAVWSSRINYFSWAFFITLYTCRVIRTLSLWSLLFICWEWFICIILIIISILLNISDWVIFHKPIKSECTEVAFNSNELRLILIIWNPQFSSCCFIISGIFLNNTQFIVKIPIIHDNIWICIKIWSIETNCKFFAFEKISFRCSLS